MHAPGKPASSTGSRAKPSLSPNATANNATV